MNQSLRKFPLFTGENQQPSRARDPQHESALWVAVCLVALALEAQACGDEPAVVVEPHNGHLSVRIANRRARALGVRPGLKLSAALAISDSLRIFERSIKAEQASLDSLAIWSHSLTPTISLEHPDALLLEVGGSRKLFGGIESIEQALVAQIRKRGLSFRLSVAPTPGGALWLARDGNHRVFGLDRMARLLRSLPLHVTAWPGSVRSRLEEMGLTSIGDCLRMPRAGFAKRVGPRYLQELDRALGRQADPRAVIDLPRTLSSKVDFSFETHDLEIILEAAESMVERMVGILRRSQRQVRLLTFAFHHLHREPSIEAFELIEADHEKRRFLDLFSDRLERLCLPAPVVALELRTGNLQPMHINPPDLFGDRDSRQRRDRVLAERLRERLGPRSVYGIALAEDHRPEAAWSEIAEGNPVEKNDLWLSPWAGMRPLWLLPSPSPLASRSGTPLYDGLLRIDAGPERIESGWWDKQDVRRDYYIASSERGERLWIYLDRAEGRWYLHGVFG